MTRYILKHVEDGYSVTVHPGYLLMRIKNYEIRQEIKPKALRSDDQLIFLIDVLRDKLEDMVKCKKQIHIGKYN